MVGTGRVVLPDTMPFFLRATEAVIGLVLLWTVYYFRPKRRLPPGPPSEFLLGHVRIVPADNPELAFHEWSKQYGDVLYFNVNQPVVVLNSVQSAVDLLDKRGANYCDRPSFSLFEVMGWTRTLTFLRWGPHFQLHRKIIQSYFTKPNIVAFRDLQTSEARILAKNIISAPGDFNKFLRRFATAIVLSIAFGHQVASDDDPYIQISADVSYALGHAGPPAGTLVDFFPFIKHLPTWLARSKSLVFAREWRWAIRKLHDVPFSAVLEQMNKGIVRPSFLLALMERLPRDGSSGDLETEDAKGAAATLYAAAQDTTWSTLLIFLLNMVLNPDVQAKAQAQIDAVIGSHCLPEFGDRESLPYIDYIVQETLRWHPVTPLGVPHKSLNDDVYRGMFIPKGSVVYANAMSMCHDEMTYKDPSVFNPDRYAPKASGGNGEPFPTGHFGFGRRICPGRHLADASLWIVIATVLATVRIGKEIGPDGKDITPEVVFTSGLTSHPQPFKCTIAPRSQQLKELVINATS